MSVVVFVGPSLSTDEVRAVLDAECRPPAAQGDVYRAALDRPAAIGLIDGYFDGVPAVWHKEILWAMGQGIPVFGSASMGALRAAELCDFGMRGVGRIFEDYRDGRLEDDDEVAVLHAPAELGFAPLSEPMVSIRATLAKAEAEGVVSSGARDALLAVAKALNYRDRRWQTIFERLADGEIAEAERSALHDWLTEGRVDAKREDALAMLAAISGQLSGAQPAPAVDHAFERTNNWELLAERIHSQSIMSGAFASVLDELRLDRGRFDALRDRAVLRCLAVAEAQRNGTAIGRKELHEEISASRLRHGLVRRQQFLDWLDENELSEGQHETLAAQGRLARSGAAIPSEALQRAILAELKMSGAFAGLKRRAEDKARVLDASGARHMRRGSLPDDLALLVWYFERRLGRAIPGDIDAYAREIGLQDRQELYRILDREYVYFAARQNETGVRASAASPTEA